jgi:hypothetical protein
MSFSSVAEKSFTGIVTRPKEIAPFHIERGMPLVCLMPLTVAPGELSGLAINPGSRAAVRRRSERRCSSSANDDDDGGCKARSARSECSERSNQT